MKTYAYSTDRLEITAPYTLASGAGCQVGSVFGVAVNAYASGAKAVIATVGAYVLAKDGSAPTDLAKAYWDDAAKKATTTAGANLRIGVFRAAAAPDATATVLLGFNA